MFTAALVFKRFGLPKDVAHYLLEFLYTRDEVRIMTRFVADRHAGTITRQSAYIDRFLDTKMAETRCLFTRPTRRHTDARALCVRKGGTVSIVGRLHFRQNFILRCEVIE